MSKWVAGKFWAVGRLSEKLENVGGWFCKKRSPMRHSRPVVAEKRAIPPNQVTAQRIPTSAALAPMLQVVNVEESAILLLFNICDYPLEV